MRASSRGLWLTVAALLSAAGQARSDEVRLSKEEELRYFIDQLDRFADSSCLRLAVEKQTFGDVHIRMGKPPSVPGSSISAEAARGLSPEVAKCVEDAVRAAAAQYFPEGGRQDVDRVISIGIPVARLPPIESLLADWRSAATKPAAREALRKQLSHGISVTDEGCILVPSSPSLFAGVRVWLGQAGPAIFDVAFADGVTLFDQLGPVAPPKGWKQGVVVDPETVLLYDRHGSEERFFPESRLCLLPLDGPTRATLEERLGRFSTCLSGSLADRLAHPHSAFPPNNRYRAVSAGTGLHSCAIDPSGHVDCCGRKAPTPPAGTFTQVMPSDIYDCGILSDGSLTCWGQGAWLKQPARGPFAEGAAERFAVCAVSRDRQLSCWGTPVNPEAQKWAAPVARVSIDKGGVCALRQSGEVGCWRMSAGLPDPVRGPFKAFATHSNHVCGVTAPDGKITCWYKEPSRREETDRRQPIPGAGFVDVALSHDCGCALDKAGKLSCWPADFGRNFSGTFRAVSGGNRICALATDGRIVCDERPYY